MLPPLSYAITRFPRAPRAQTAPFRADRLRELADELAACGSVQTAAICRAMADEVDGR